jgi:type 1 fimbria pilin
MIKENKMKKILLAAAFLIAIVVCVYSETLVYQPGTSGTNTLNSEVRYCYVYETDGDVNDFNSVEFDIGNAVIDRVVVDANGTDTSFKLYLYDCATTYHDCAIWSKVDCSTASMPISQAVVLSDGTGNHPGCPVNGHLKITLADGDDASMSHLEMYIYYHRR